MLVIARQTLKTAQLLLSLTGGALLAGSCSSSDHEVTVPFEVHYAGQPVACNAALAEIQLTDLRFYISNVRMGGRPSRLKDDDFWQNADVALVDFEDGTGNCVNGTPGMHKAVSILVSGQSESGLQFDIGVPELLNHQNPVTAEPPLSFTDMHWHWISGYKFLRAGVRNEDDGFWLHLGSTRCSGTIGDVEGCQSANRPRVSLPDFIAGRDKVVIDLALLFAEVDMTDSIASDCSSGPAETACLQPFARLGIDFESGEQVSGPSIFRHAEILR